MGNHHFRRLTTIGVLKILLVVVLLGCISKDEETDFDFEIELKNDEPSRIELYILDPFDFSKKHLLDTVLSGTLACQLDLEIPTFAAFKYKDRHKELYLEPNKAVKLTITASDSMILAKSGSEVNVLLHRLQNIHTRYQLEDNQYLPYLPVEQFLEKLNNWRQTINNEMELHADSLDLSKDETDMIRDLEFSLLQFYTFGNILAHQNYYAEQSSFLDSLVANMTLSDELLAKNSSTYAQYLHAFTMVKRVLDSNVLKHRRGIQISEGDYRPYNFPKGVQEHLAAKYTDNLMGLEGLTSRVDSLFFVFLETFPKSKYEDRLTNHRKAWLDLGPGKKAPEIKAVQLSGDTISSKDFLGQLLYVDLWATWCKPCIAEFPAAAELHEAYRDDDRVRFINISVDGEKSKWESFLTKNQYLSGDQFFALRKDSRILVWSDYRISSIPRYLLIDHEGKIIDVMAPRPSSDEIRKLLDEALARMPS